MVENLMVFFAIYIVYKYFALTFNHCKFVNDFRNFDYSLSVFLKTNCVIHILTLIAICFSKYKTIREIWNKMI